MNSALLPGLAPVRCAQIAPRQPGFWRAVAPRSVLPGSRSLFVHEAPVRGPRPVKVASDGSKEGSSAPAVELTAPGLSGSVSGAKVLVSKAWKLFKTYMLPLLALALINTVASYFLNRVCHRLTNAVFLAVNEAVFPDKIWNLWWLCAKPEIANFETGYQYLVGLGFLIFLPLHIALSAVLNAATLLLATKPPSAPADQSSDDAESSNNEPSDQPKAAASASSSEASTTGNDATAEAADAERRDAEAAAGPSGDEQTDAPSKGKGAGLFRTLFSGGAEAVRALGAVAGDQALAKRAFVAELLLTARVLPLQAACLLVLPLPWALPRLLDLQLTLPYAVLRGAEGKQAIAASALAVKPVRNALGVAFVALLVASRAANPLRDLLLRQLPNRLYTATPEIVLLVLLIFQVAGVLLGRALALLPLATYQESGLAESPVPQDATVDPAEEAAVQAESS